jgi:protein-disulfide isomerase
LSDGSDAGEERRRRLLQLASAAVFLAIVGVGVLIVLGSSQTSGGDTKLEDVGAVRRQLAGLPQEGMALGDRSARVTLLEFGDLQCPVCKAFSERVLPAVIESKVRGGEARIEFRNFTIIGEESIPAGAAAIAAGEQGRGWSFVELFYRNQGEENSGYVSDEFLAAIARGAGVGNMTRWNRERRSARIRGEVEASTAEAQRLGFEGTPSFAVQGPGTSGPESVPLSESPSTLEEAIEGAR